MSVVDAQRMKNRHDVKLESGLLVTIRLPRMRDCIIAGDVPLPVLEKLETGGDLKGSDVSAEDLRGLAAYNDALVMMAVIAIEGEDVNLAREDLVDVFMDEDYNEIAAYAKRAKPLPGKG